MSTTAETAIKTVRDAIDAAGVSATIRTQKTAPKSVADKATAMGADPGAIVRAEMYLIGKKPVLALLSGERTCRLDQLPRIFFMKGKVVKAKADEIRKMAGFAASGLGPAGLKTQMPVAIDIALKDYDALFCVAGHPTAVLELDVSGLKRLTGGIVSYALAEDPATSA